MKKINELINYKPIRICADIIATYNNNIVLIERLGDNNLLAMPGGGQDGDETLSVTAIREMKEETGLNINIKEVLGTYTNHDNRTDRHSISTVFIAEASGEVRNEENKTRVKLLTLEELKEIINSKDVDDRFAFMHQVIINDYIQKYVNR